MILLFCLCAPIAADLLTTVAGNSQLLNAKEIVHLLYNQRIERVHDACECQGPGGRGLWKESRRGVWCAGGNVALSQPFAVRRWIPTRSMTGQPTGPPTGPLTGPPTGPSTGTTGRTTATLPQHHSNPSAKLQRHRKDRTTITGQLTGPDHRLDRPGPLTGPPQRYPNTTATLPQHCNSTATAPQHHRSTGPCETRNPRQERSQTGSLV